MDIFHDVGADLTIDPDGRLMTVTDDAWTRQRVVRRLLTNAGDYIWDLSYGGGLRREIGGVVAARRIEASILRQLRLEAAVARQPGPKVVVSEPVSGTVNADITYVDAHMASTTQFSVAIGDAV